jgi:hypothetical protein
MPNLPAIIIAMVMLASCSLGGRLDAYVGKPKDDYFRKNGPPDKSRTLNDGTIVHSYLRTNGEYTCTINIKTDSSGIIIGWSHGGC